MGTVVDMDASVGPAISEKIDGRADPLFTVTDKQVAVWGRFRHNSLPAFVSKKMPDHTAWFSSTPLLDARSLRFVFEQAGVHFYGEMPSIVYGGSGMLTAHFKNGGTHTLTLRNGRKVLLQLPEGPATVVLDAESGELLMGGK